MNPLTVFLGAAALAIANPAHADTYNYMCELKDAMGKTHLYPVKADDTKRTITWRGNVYTDIKDTFGYSGDGCPKHCLGNKSISLDIKTKGFARLQVYEEGDYDCEIMDEF
jgi:hypothetical protein